MTFIVTQSASEAPAPSYASTRKTYVPYVKPVRLKLELAAPLMPGTFGPLTSTQRYVLPPDTVEYITVKDIDRAIQGLKAQVSALQYDEQLKASIEYLRSAIKEAARIRRNKKP